MKKIITLLLLSTTGLMASAFAQTNSCNDPNLIACLHYTVNDQPVMHGHYVKFKTNGKLYPLGVMCVSDDSSWGFESGDVPLMMTMGLIKLGDNTATSTQCSDKKCSSTLPSVEYKFNLHKENDQYVATPSRSEVYVQNFGEACTVQPPMKHFK